jgi:hypothetical protein
MDFRVKDKGVVAHITRITHGIFELGKDGHLL